MLTLAGKKEIPNPLFYKDSLARLHHEQSRRKRFIVPKMKMSAGALIFLSLAPLLLVPALFFTVLHLDGVPVPRATFPREVFVANRCTWACHNSGCRHRSFLPAAFVADDGLFGNAVKSLYGLGAVLAPGRRGAGYGAANLLVFCAVWPGGMYLLWLIALAQRRRMRARSESTA